MFRCIAINFIIFSLVLVSAVAGSLVRFEEGYQYEYDYKANVTLDKVDTIKISAKV